jgi:DNA-binding transcriptional ArsR family regulator
MPRHSPYRAISDPTRRRILDLLRDAGPQRAGAIAVSFPRISRPAVSKHLRILRQARLVRETAQGRERWYRLNPEPLRELYDSWLRHYEAFWTERLATLKQIVEEDERARRTRRRDNEDDGRRA